MSNLMEAYEALRAFALGQQADGPPPKGLVVFRRQGMAGWIGVWSEFESPPYEASPLPEGTWERIGRPLPDEVASLLAGMALAGGR